MNATEIVGLACFLGGLAAGFLVQFALCEIERRAQLRQRFRSPPFTTVGAGRRD
jgi:hypothetical protein